MAPLTLVIGNKNYSSWSLRAWLFMKHAGVEFEEILVRLDTAETREQLDRYGPSGRVPVLQHGNLRVWDSLAICEYVAEQHPALWPADRAERARARSISAEMHSGFAAMRRDMSMDLGASKPGVGHTVEALADVRRVQQIWREQLAKSGGPFLFGTFTIADAMFAPVTTRFVTYGVDLDAPCRGYVDAIAAHPAMKQWAADAAREPVTRY
jgi:glutathione S-transferase